ncbi:MAG: hypothetical protein HOQ21_09130, partial [Dermatophilaceae bacterium]|nr:hypothetical protein [Dermatophilaceae bacterium]
MAWVVVMGRGCNPDAGSRSSRFPQQIRRADRPPPATMGAQGIRSVLTQRGSMSETSPDHANECQVLVVGAGPAGVVAALLLGDLGVDTVLVDRRTSVSDLPRARGIHARATEMLRQLGIEPDMVASALPTDARMEVRSTLAEPPLVTIPTGGETFAEVSPCEGIAIAQDVFERVLRAHLPSRERVSVRLGQRLTGLTTDPSGATATLDDADGTTHTIHSAYVIGADGWRSDVRRLAGIDVIGDLLGQQRCVRFRADLTPWLGAPPPSFVRMDATDAVLLPTHPDHRWVSFHIAELGPEDPADLVGRMLGVETGAEVLGDVLWEAGVQYAERFRQGQVFLAGDAAHRVTPIGATGITSAMADGHNLAWKLAAVLGGWAPDSLLDTYAVERGAVARSACATNRLQWEAARTGGQPNIDLRMLDMGYRYASSIVTPDPRFPDEQPSSYTQSAAPGARAPHAWLDHAAGRSTIDLFGRAFVALVATDDPAPLADVGARSRVPLEVHALVDGAA